MHAKKKIASSLVAMTLALLMQPVAFSATIADTPFLLEYEAGLNETNIVTIQPLFIAGSILLEISDSAGLNGCVQNPGSVITVRCDADELALFTMDMGNKNDRVTVIETGFGLSDYQLSVIGGLGDDTLTGGVEDDEFLGGSGEDTLDGNAGPDSLFGELGDDRLLGGTGSDRLDGGPGNDILFGEAGNDTLDGGTFDDSLHGGSGTDTMRGGSGGDFIDAVDRERDVIDCGLGRDRVRADPIDSVDRNCEDVDRVVF